MTETANEMFVEERLYIAGKLREAAGGRTMENINRRRKRSWAWRPTPTPPTWTRRSAPHVPFDDGVVGATRRSGSTASASCTIGARAARR
jgi:hypothetical protein